MSNEYADQITDDAQRRAFEQGIASQQEIGKEALEREEKARAEMQRHMDIVTKAFTNPDSLDHNDPHVRAVLGMRAQALSSALRAHGKK